MMENDGTEFGEEVVSLEEQASMEDTRRFLLEEEWDGGTSVTLLDGETLVDDLRENLEQEQYSGDGARPVYIGCYMGHGVFRQMVLRLVDCAVQPDLQDYFYHRYELDWADDHEAGDRPGLGFTLKIGGRA